MYEPDGGTDRLDLLEPALVIRRVSALDEYRQCERLQERIWGREGVARVPILALLIAQENGGLVLGAFDRDLLVGFVFSFLGTDGGNHLKCCSVVLAVAPEYRHRGIGRKLKLAQRDEALTQGIDLITWTYDPLMATNARLNVSRLGVVSRTYRANLYGTDQGVNPGLDTDRLIAEWHLRAEPGRFADPDGAAPVPVVTVAAAGGLPQITGMELDADAATLLLPIPCAMQELLLHDFELARQWRLQTRTLFETYFRRGYAVAGFTDLMSPAGTASYILRRDLAR